MSFLDLSYLKHFIYAIYKWAFLPARISSSVGTHAYECDARLCAGSRVYVCVCVGPMPVYRCTSCTDVHVCVVCLCVRVYLGAHEHTCVRLVPDAS